MSDGRLDITYYPAATLVPTLEMMDGVAQGIVEFGMASPAYWAGIDPAATALWSLPFGVGSLELISDLYWNRGMMDIARDLYEEHGVYCLGIQPICSYGDLQSTVPIYNVDDLKGLKIRSFGIYADVVEAMGGSVTVVPSEEFYLAISTGVIEAGMWGGPGAFWDLKLHEVAKYITQPGWGYPAHNDAFINLDAWNELPDDLKEILKVANELRGLEIIRCFVADDMVALGKMQSEWDVTVCWWDDAALSEARVIALQAWDDLEAQSDYAAKVVGLYKDYMKEVGLM
jgi:TRAP-type mannitol/chloroaromatic compound transport system substrate-binding protein